LYYTYRQNNSSGGRQGPRYITIEAESADEANTLAPLVSDIYFNGVRDGYDCPCCGDRWIRVDEDEGTDVPDDSTLVIYKEEYNSPYANRRERRPSVDIDPDR
jgi:hypothetical protein